MPWIANYSLPDILNGQHALEEGNTFLIRIADVGREMYCHEPRNWTKFADIRYFNFQDLESKEVHEESQYGEMTQDQANQIVFWLRKALEYGNNVVVHCNAGLCRSGAVAEVGVMMGFEDLGRPRIPNTHVKKLLMKAAGFDWNQLFEERAKTDATSRYYVSGEGGILRPREE